MTSIRTPHIRWRLYEPAGAASTGRNSRLLWSSTTQNTTANGSLRRLPSTTKALHAEDEVPCSLWSKMRTTCRRRRPCISATRAHCHTHTRRVQSAIRMKHLRPSALPHVPGRTPVRPATTCHPSNMSQTTTHHDSHQRGGTHTRILACQYSHQAVQFRAIQWFRHPYARRLCDKSPSDKKHQHCRQVSSPVSTQQGKKSRHHHTKRLRRMRLHHDCATTLNQQSTGPSPNTSPRCNLKNWSTIRHINRMTTTHMIRQSSLDKCLLEFTILPFTSRVLQVLASARRVMPPILAWIVTARTPPQIAIPPIRL